MRPHLAIRVAERTSNSMEETNERCARIDPRRLGARGHNPSRSERSRASWLQALLTEACRAAEAGQRYLLLRYGDPAQLALQEIKRADITRLIFEEFYADPHPAQSPGSLDAISRLAPSKEPR
jgi:hypothetical protein